MDSKDLTLACEFDHYLRIVGSLTPDVKSSIPVADGTTEFPTWNYTVKDTAPVWAFVCTSRTLPLKTY